MILWPFHLLSVIFELMAFFYQRADKGRKLKGLYFSKQKDGNLEFGCCKLKNFVILYYFQYFWRYPHCWNRSNLNKYEYSKDGKYHYTSGILSYPASLLGSSLLPALPDRCLAEKGLGGWRAFCSHSHSFNLLFSHPAQADGSNQHSPLSGQVLHAFPTRLHSREKAKHSERHDI